MCEVISIYSINQAKILEFKYDDIHASRHENYRSVPIHCHEYMELELVVSGKGTNFCNGISVPISSGSMYLLTPSDFHRISTTEPLTLYNVSFRETLLSEAILAKIYNRETNRIRSEIDGDMIVTAVKLFEILEQYNDAPKSAKLLAVRVSLLEAMIGILLMHTKPVEEKLDGASSRMLKILLYLHQHFAEGPSLAQVSREVGLNPSYVSKKFKEQFDITYVEYLTRLKLSYAKTLLITCDKPVLDVCCASGFNSLSNFMSIFKKQVGMTPMQYRTLYSEKQKS